MSLCMAGTEAPPCKTRRAAAMEDHLPVELLSEILRRLQRRDLAVCRGVRKCWRDAVDADGLLPPASPPPTPRSIFVNYMSARRWAAFFSRPGPSSIPVDGALGRFVPGRPTGHRGVLDHRAGLFLYENMTRLHVCNPATRRCATLPPPPLAAPPPLYRRRMHLVFDPAASLHYRVLFLPDAPDYQWHGDAAAMAKDEWPPRAFPVQAFSSRTGQWDDETFTREQDTAAAATTTVSDVWSEHPTKPTSGANAFRRHSVCSGGALYVHCRGGFLVKLSLQQAKYRVIRAPSAKLLLPDDDAAAAECAPGRRRRFIQTFYGYLAKSKDDICYTAIHGYQIQVWTLREAQAAAEDRWEVRHPSANLEAAFARLHHRRRRRCNDAGSWILNPREEQQSGQEEHGWDSDNDGGAAEEEDDKEEGAMVGSRLQGFRDDHHHYHGMEFLGYHPCKEIVFLGSSFSGFAYHLESSRLEYLGSLFPASGRDLDRLPLCAPALESFVYTPCIYDSLPGHDDA